MQNFSTATAKKTAIYSPKNENKHPSEMKNEQHNSHFTITKVFPGLGPILVTGLKYWLNVSFLQIVFWKEQSVKQSVKQICTPPIWIRLSDFESSYAEWCS